MVVFRSVIRRLVASTPAVEAEAPDSPAVAATSAEAAPARNRRRPAAGVPRRSCSSRSRASRLCPGVSSVMIAFEKSRARLELQMRAQLENARLVPGYQSGDLSKSRAALLRIRVCETRMIEYVQHFQTKLEFDAFPNRKIL